MTTNQAAVLREVVVTLKEENAVFKCWLKDKLLSEDVMQGMEISLEDQWPWEKFSRIGNTV